MVEWLQSKSEADAIPVAEVEEISRHWSEEPPIAVCLRAWMGVKPPEELDEGEGVEPSRELTEEEWKRKCDGLKAYAAEHGGPRNGVARG